MVIDETDCPLELGLASVLISYLIALKSRNKIYEVVNVIVK